MLSPPPRTPAGAAPPEVGGELAAQLAAGLDVERLVDRLVADPHLRVLGVFDLQSGRYLLRGPAPGQPGLDRCPKPRGARELARLGPGEAPDRDSLGSECPVAGAASAALDLTADRRGGATEVAGDRASRLSGGDPATDPLALLKAKPQPRVLDTAPAQLRL